MSTRLFLRSLLCQPGGNGAGCGAPFARLGVAGLAHHTYVRGGGGSPLRHDRGSDLSIARLGPLEAILDQAALRRRVPSRLPIFITEHGFQTDPPDDLLGVPLVAQAAFLDASEWIAYRNPRVASVAQYLLRDEQERAGFQTGLRFTDGTAKPSLDAYRLPIWIRPRGSGIEVFGRVRPARDVATIADLQRLRGRRFVTVRRIRTIPPGSEFVTRVAALGGTWRLRWRKGRRVYFSRQAVPIG